MREKKKSYTREELAAFNGQNGQPAYVVHEGRVIDVSESKRWKDGKHMNRHQAGTDLTADIASAPHGTEVLDRFPDVGGLAAEGPEESPVPEFVQELLDRFPFLQRHPHPMFVHFPIVFMIFAPVFTVLYLIFDYPPFEATAFHMLGVGSFMSIIAIATGFATWWLNYMAKGMLLVNVKIVFSFLLLGLSSAALCLAGRGPPGAGHHEPDGRVVPAGRAVVVADRERDRVLRSGTDLSHPRRPQALIRAAGRGNGIAGKGGGLETEPRPLVPSPGLSRSVPARPWRFPKGAASSHRATNQRARSGRGAQACFDSSRTDRMVRANSWYERGLSMNRRIPSRRAWSAST